MDGAGSRTAFSTDLKDLLCLLDRLLTARQNPESVMGVARFDDRTRLNNIIWREWMRQNKLGRTPVVVNFHCRTILPSILRQRIIIGGTKDAGKTSLRRFILDQPFRESPGYSANEVGCLEIFQSGVWTKSQESVRAPVVEKGSESSLDTGSLTTRPERIHHRNYIGLAMQVHDLQIQPVLDLNNNSSRTFEKNTRWMLAPLHMVQSSRNAKVLFEGAKSEVNTDRQIQPIASCQLAEIHQGEGKGETLASSGKGLQPIIWELKSLQCAVPYWLLPPFLDLQTIYIWVLDGTKGLDEELDSSRTDREGQRIETSAPNTPGKCMDHYFNLIFTHLRRREPRGSPSLFVVVTKKNLVSEDQQRHLRRQIRNSYLEQKVYGDHIRQIFYVDSSKPTDRGIVQLREAIWNEAEQQGIWNKELPVGSIQLSRLLRNVKSVNEACPIVRFSDLQFGLQMNEKETKTFLEQFITHGFLVCIEDLVVWRPQWLVELFQRLLTTGLREFSSGRSSLKWKWVMEQDEYAQIRQDMMEVLWGKLPEKYTEALLRIMIKFEMILPLHTKDSHPKFIVPPLLHCVRELLPEEYLAAPPLIYAFYTDPGCDAYLPEGLFPRLAAHFWNGKSPWKQHRKLLSDYAAFDVYLKNMPALTVTIRKLHDVIQLSAYILPPEKALSPLSPPADVHNEMLVNIRETFEHSLKGLTADSGFYSNLDGNLTLCMECSCTQKERSGNYVPIDEVKIFSHPEVVCQTHDRRLSTVKYRKWFPVQRTSQTDPDVGLMTINIQRDEDPTSKLSQKSSVYRLCCRYRGVVNIIVNTEFRSGTDLEQRPESTFDKANLERLFEQLNFWIEVKENQTAKEMKLWINNLARRDFFEMDSFFLCILSHGSSGCVKGVDGCDVCIQEDVIDKFSGIQSSGLLGKPKVFLFQSCRGRKITEGRGQTSYLSVCEPASAPRQNSKTPDLNETAHHEAADILEIYATLPGYAAFSNETGSWFIRAFVEQVCNSAHELHLADILIDVNETLPRRMTNTGKKCVQQIQVVNSGFKRFYFCPEYYPIVKE